jgi:hypothetical protein
MIKPYLFYFLVMFFLRYSNATAQNNSTNNTKVNNQKIDYKIVESINNTWGYDIFINNKLKIHQTTIPSLSGNDGFKTKKSAIKTAELVISKIKNGEMPPTITTDELKKIKAI